jgi:hypothetical protein
LAVVGSSSISSTRIVCPLSTQMQEVKENG